MKFEPIVDVLAEYAALSGNLQQKYYLTQLKGFMAAWRDLLKEVVFEVKRKVVKVSSGDKGRYVDLPADVMRLFFVTRTGECNKVDMFKPGVVANYDLPKKPCAKHKTAGCMCDYTDNPVITYSDVVIDGQVYKKKEWLFRDGNQLRKTIQFPVKKYTDPETYTIGWETTDQLICEVEVNGDLVPDTKDNCKKIIEHCGSCHAVQVKESLKYELVGNRVYLSSIDESVVLSYQSNGYCDEDEIMVPDYAIQALQFGADYKIHVFKGSISPSEKREKQRLYKSSITDLLKFKNPIIAEQFVEAGMGFPKW